MKTATYRLTNGKELKVEYDENAPCKYCNLPVVEASTSGTDVCPWCDCGYNRDGTKKNYYSGITTKFLSGRDEYFNFFFDLNNIFLHI